MKRFQCGQNFRKGVWSNDFCRFSFVTESGRGFWTLRVTGPPGSTLLYTAKILSEQRKMHMEPEYVTHQQLNSPWCVLRLCYIYIIINMNSNSRHSSKLCIYIHLCLYAVWKQPKFKKKNLKVTQKNIVFYYSEIMKTPDKHVPMSRKTRMAMATMNEVFP